MRWCWVLGVGVLGSALAQEGSRGMSDAERAKRDAEKVFSFIKFQTVKKPSATPSAAPVAAAPSPRPAAARSDTTPPARSRPAAPESGAPAAQVSAPTLASAPPAAAEASKPQGGVAAEEPPRQAVPPAAPGPALGAPVQQPAAAAPAPPEPEPEDQEVELKLVDFVAPELTPQIQATLGASSPVVKLRFMVGTDGKVQSARAVEGVSRRLGQVAERAVLQWRFEPLPAAREVEVEIAFKR